MAWWQVALLLLAVVWGIQAVGTWFQMKHYREILGAVTSRWSDGYVGVGSARAALGKGVILLLVLSPDNVVRRLLVMEGRSVFAKFRPLEEYEGMSLDALKVNPSFAKGNAGRATALEQAMTQIDRTRSNADEEGKSPLNLAKLQQEQS